MDALVIVIPQSRVHRMSSSTTDPVNVAASEAAEPQAPAAQRSVFNNAFVRVPVLLVLLLAAVIYEARHVTAFSDFDIWYHLSTGTWILQHHALPHNGLFSQYSERTWLAYSWGFEIIAATLYKLLGLRALPVLLMGLNLALAGVLFWLARGSKRNFWPAVLLSAAGQYAAPALNARPSF